MKIFSERLLSSVLALVLSVGIFTDIGFRPNLIYGQSVDQPIPFGFYFSGASLKIGDQGEDVLNLQKFLNLDSDTQVSLSGPGSPGQETRYFGPATRLAVMKFQEKHKSEILSPLGLVSPTGFVGSSTFAKIRAVMAFLSAQNEEKSLVSEPINQNPSNFTVENPPQQQTTGVPMNIQPISGPISKPTNLFEGASFSEILDDSKKQEIPFQQQVSSQISENLSVPAKSNLENIDEMASLILSVGRSQGFSEADLDKALKALKDNASSANINYLEEFERQMRSSGAVAVEKQVNLFAGFWREMTGVFEEIFAPKAHAFGLSFGGMVITTMMCTCSGNWLVGMRPYKVGGPFLLTHYMGNQMYLNMNFPMSRYVLGFYAPAGAPCMMYAGITCISIPSQGMTTSRIGTSM